MSTTWLKNPFTLAIGVVLVAVMGGGQIAGASPNPGVIAYFNGGTINLANGWEGAQVCAVAATGTYCFSSQAGYQAWLSNSSVVTDIGSTSNTNCPSALDLFSATGYKGTELSLLDEAVWINLSTYGFSAKTNSYKVGACKASMTAAANGGGSVYPGPMAAGTNASSMQSGWASRIASAYIL